MQVTGFAGECSVIVHGLAARRSWYYVFYLKTEIEHLLWGAAIFTPITCALCYNSVKWIQDLTVVIA
jgi:hypothetical protein